MREFKRWFRLFVLVLCTAATACGDTPSASVTAVEVRVTAAATEIFAGESTRLSVVALDSRGRTTSVRPAAWSSGNASVATVAQDGLVTGHSPGTVTVRATVDGAFGEVALTVRPVPVASVSIQPDSTTLTVGDSIQLVAVPMNASGNPLAGRSIVWSSSDTTLVTITMAGLAKAVRTGRVTITAVSEGKAGSARVVASRGAVPDRHRIAAGANFTCVLDATGAAWCWGGNADGQLGDGGTTNRLTAVAVTGGHTFRAISAGGTSVCGLKDAGEVFFWGRLLGTSSTSSTPVRSFALLLQSLDVSDRHACGLSTEGVASCWGVNDYRQLGRVDPTPQPEPVAVVTEHRFASLSVSARTSCGITSVGESYCWGVYQHTDLSAYFTESPRRIPADGRFSSVVPGYDHACGIQTDGSTSCWNKNTLGQLGTGTRNDALTPATIAGGVQMRALALMRGYTTIGFFTCGIATDDAPYCWGASNSGQIGSRDATERCSTLGGVVLTCSTSPKRVAGGLAASAIVAGDLHACVITRDKKIYCWGGNSNGQLGNGSTAVSSEPVRSVFSGVM
jgi:hypothetical protein